MKDIDQIRFLIFERGGIAGAIRRIVGRWRGIITVSFVRAALGFRYPLLDPAPYQIQDVLDSLARFGWIRRVWISISGNVYHRVRS